MGVDLFFSNPDDIDLQNNLIDPVVLGSVQYFKAGFKNITC